MRLLLMLRDPDVIHSSQYLQHHSDTYEQSNKTSTIFLLPLSSDKNQPTHAFNGSRQGKEMLFLFISVHLHPSSFLANIPKKCFARWPLPVLLTWLQRKKHKI